MLTKFLFEVEKFFKEPRTNSKNYWLNTFNVGKIYGGNATNQVAELATAECDIRFVEGERPERIIDNIKKLCPKGISVEVMFNEPMVNSDPKNILLEKYCASVKNITGKKAELISEHGSSDARFFADQKIPIIISEPEGDNLHGKDEWVSIDSITSFYNIIADFVKNI